MKKHISVILSLVLVLLAVIQLPLTASAEITMAVVTKGASVRSTPSYNGKKVVMAKPGDQYLYLGTEGSWYEVQVSADKKGYLPKSSCRLEVAPGVPTSSTTDAFASIINALRAGSGYETNLPEAFNGKTVLGVYYDLDAKADELSTDVLASEGSYWSVPAELLAKNMKEADWALLIYPKITKDTDDPLKLNVFPVDVKNSVYYAPYQLEDRETVLENDEKRYELDSTLRGIKEMVFSYKLERAVQLATDENYQLGLRLLKEERYFSAFEAFNMSDLEEAAEMAKTCAQPWPKTGEIWHNSAVKGSNMMLTVKVNQDSDRALIVRIYKDYVQAACLFIAGTGEASTRLPGGTYVIKDGSGEEWFGFREAFGRYGHYETMTFGEDGTQEVKLQAGHGYTITLNVEHLDPGADSVGSESQDWEGFSE